MPSKTNFYVYWDSCVFLSWMEETPERLEVILDSLRDAKERGGKVLTSSISIAEVAFVAQEKEQGVLDISLEKRLDELWGHSFVQLVDASHYVMKNARRLMRQAMLNGWSMKAADAIHLSTAQYINDRSPARVSEFFTYDGGLEKYSTTIGIQICRPHIENPQKRLI